MHRGEELAKTRPLFQLADTDYIKIREATKKLIGAKDFRRRNAGTTNRKKSFAFLR
jgi:hypothetical protein